MNNKAGPNNIKINIVFFNNKDKRLLFLLNIIYKLNNNTNNKKIRVEIANIAINSPYKKLLKKFKILKLI